LYCCSFFSLCTFFPSKLQGSKVPLLARTLRESPLSEYFCRGSPPCLRALVRLQTQHTPHAHALGTSPAEQTSFFSQGLGCATAFSAGHCWTQARSCTLICFGPDHRQFFSFQQIFCCLGSCHYQRALSTGGSRAFCYLYPMALPAPISCRLQTKTPTQFCSNSQQSSAIRKATCIFCRVHLHSPGFLFLFMLSSHMAKQSIPGMVSCPSLLERKVNNLSLVLQLDSLSWGIPAAPQSLDSSVGTQRNASPEHLPQTAIFIYLSNHR